MDEQRFDELTRRLAGSRSRRSLLKGLAAVVAGVLGGRIAPPVAADSEPDSDRDDNNGRGCKRAGKNCKKHSQCCSGLNCADSGFCKSGCWIDGKAVWPGVHPSNPCLTCDPARNTDDWSPIPAQTPCSDATTCTSAGTCDGAGTCVSYPLPPRVDCPANQNVATNGGTCGAVATFTASAECGSVVCSHENGATFPLGTTTISCTAENEAGSDACSFTVTVTDGSDPDIACPADIQQPATSAQGAIVNFTASATDNCSGVQVACVPASGGQFPIGTTNVTCTATDASSRQDECSFQVRVTCAPDCTGKNCGDSDGCGGACIGSCADPGPCASSACDESTRTCDTRYEPAGTFCDTPCRSGGTCNGSGLCIGGTEPVCNQPPGECYRDTGACDEQTGECVYEQLPAGEQCGTPTSLCRPRTCTAAGACEEHPVECHAECQMCNESTGTCLNFNENGVCGDGLKRCSSGQCVSPCGDSCVDYCYENLGLDGTRTNTFFCCPEEARGPNGVCCWVNGGPGTISDDGFCVSPRQVCADGLKCDAECCGSSSTGRAGTCPSIGEFCVGNGTAIARGETCTSDADCTYEANGATIVYGVCTDLDFTIIPEVGPQPVPNSGTCCASGYYAIEGAGSFGLDYFCCEGHKRITFGSNGPECCSFPAYASGGCIGCTCSFNRITRCCA